MALYRWSTKLSGIWNWFNPATSGSVWEVLKRTSNWYDWDSVNEFEPGNEWSTDQVLTKTAWWYEWATAWVEWYTISESLPACIHLYKDWNYLIYSNMKWKFMSYQSSYITTYSIVGQRKQTSWISFSNWTDWDMILNGNYYVIENWTKTLKKYDISWTTITNASNLKTFTNQTCIIWSDWANIVVVDKSTKKLSKYWTDWTFIEDVATLSWSYIQYSRAFNDWYLICYGSSASENFVLYDKNFNLVSWDTSWSWDSYMYPIVYMGHLYISFKDGTDLKNLYHLVY